MQTIFESAFGEDVDDVGNELPNDGGDAAGVFVTGSIVVRTNNRFNIRATAPASGQWITKGALPTVVEFLCNIQTTLSAGAESWDLKRYGTLGQDPEADSAADAFTRSASGTTYVTTTNYRTTGAKTDDLGSTAVTDAIDRLQNDSSTWAIAVKQVTETKDGSSNGTVLDEYTHATAANRPRLRITWKAVRDPIGGSGMCCPGRRL